MKNERFWEFRSTCMSLSTTEVARKLFHLFITDETRTEVNFRRKLKLSIEFMKFCGKPFFSIYSLSLFPDNSDAAFYISRNRKSRNWVIRLQGGGSCVMFSECYDRQTTPFGSSKYLEEYVTGTFLTSDDPEINPTFHNWNKVFIPYCRCRLNSFINYFTDKVLINL